MDWEDRLHGLWAWIVFIVALMTIFGFVTDVFAFQTYSGCEVGCQQMYQESLNICRTVPDHEQQFYCTNTAVSTYASCLQVCGFNQVGNAEKSWGNTGRDTPGCGKGQRR